MQVKEAINKYNDTAKWVIIFVCVGALAWQFWYQIVSPEYEFYSKKIKTISHQLEGFQDDVIYAEERLHEFKLEWNKKKDELIKIEQNLVKQEQEIKRQIKTLETKINKLRGELNTGLRKVESDAKQNLQRKFQIWEHEWEKEISRSIKESMKIKF